MAIPNFTNGDGSPNSCAAMLEAALGICVYYNLRTSATQLIAAFDPAGSLDYLAYDTSMPTSILIWHIGNQWNIVIAGSQSASIVNSYVVRSLDVPFPGSDASINSFVWSALPSLRTQIQSVLPPNLAGQRLYFSGHSLGAACAQILAIEYSSMIGADNVSLLSLDAPKVLTAEFDGEIAGSWALICVPTDPVPFAPPGYLIASAYPVPFGLLLSLWQLNWHAVGRTWYLNADGSFLEADPDDFDHPSLQDLLTFNNADHFLGRILLKIISGWRAGGSAGPCAAIVNQASELATNLILRDSWPTGGPETYINQVSANARNFPGVLPGPLTAQTVQGLIITAGNYVGYALTSVGNLITISPGTQLGVRKKLMYLRGIPDRVIVDPAGPRIVADAAYLAAFREWSTAVLADGWGWMGIDVPPILTGRVYAFQLEGPGPGRAAMLTVFSSQAFALHVGDEVRFRGGDFTPKLNGVYTVLEVSPDSWFRVSADIAAVPIAIAFPNWETVTESFIRASAIQVAGETRRLTGRPRSKGRNKPRPGRGTV
jgi:Lipase (class 3)